MRCGGGVSSGGGPSGWSGSGEGWVMALWVVGGGGGGVFQRGRDRWGGGGVVWEGLREAESGGLVCTLGIGWWV